MMTVSINSPRCVERCDPDVIPRGRLQARDATHILPRRYVFRNKLEVVLRLSTVLDDKVLDGTTAVAKGVQPQSHRRPVCQDQVGQMGDVWYCNIFIQFHWKASMHADAPNELISH